MTNPQITVLGELLIDFTQYGSSPEGMALFERNAGGAVANVAVAASRLGHSCAFIGKVGDDIHGHFLADTLLSNDVDISGLVFDSAVFTTLAFVALDAGGERSFSFARKPGADTCLKPEELNRQLLTNTKLLHVGSLSLTGEPSRSATLSAIVTAKSAGAIISYDPNYRASLWSDQAAAIEQLRSVLPYVDMMKLSKEETFLLTGRSEPESAALALHRMGIACVSVTLGADGALTCIGGELVRVPACSVTGVVDTTGAGDAYWGGFLSAFLDSGLSLSQVTSDAATAFTRYASATAACCITRRGAIPAMPSPPQLTPYL